MLNFGGVYLVQTSTSKFSLMRSEEVHHRTATWHVTIIAPFSTEASLVGGWATQLKHISQNGKLAQVGVKIKNLWNHHLDDYRGDLPRVKTQDPSLPDLAQSSLHLPFPAVHKTSSSVEQLFKKKESVASFLLLCFFGHLPFPYHSSSSSSSSSTTTTTTTSKHPPPHPPKQNKHHHCQPCPWPRAPCTSGEMQVRGNKEDEATFALISRSTKASNPSWSLTTMAAPNDAGQGRDGFFGTLKARNPFSLEGKMWF